MRSAAASAGSPGANTSRSWRSPAGTRKKIDTDRKKPDSMRTWSNRWTTTNCSGCSPLCRSLDRRQRQREVLAVNLRGLDADRHGNESWRFNLHIAHRQRRGETGVAVVVSRLRGIPAAGVDGDDCVGNRLRTARVRRYWYCAGDNSERINGHGRHPLRYVDGAALKAARDRVRGQRRDDGADDGRRAASPRGSVVAHRLPDVRSQSMMPLEATQWIW